MKILIIEDEINAAKELERILLNQDTTHEVLAILDSVEASIDFLERKNPPDLIFSDIQLADGMCFEIYREVPVKSPIIFCTAYDEYMLDALETNAVSYILKPITEEAVAKAIEKFKRLKSAFEPAATTRSIEKLGQQLKYTYKKTLLVEQREKIIPLPVSDIAYLYLEHAVIKIATLKGQQYFITSTLDELERMLDPESFYRANRQFIINRLAIASIERFFSRKLISKLVVETPETIVISKANSSDFLRWLEGVGGV
ncbi:LytR/AlgR family response regulator transcription factor [Olivibacter domesticus]|uniref:Two component transcriptional regulator, LytTR family n=1 Tax=Olivibacter domesticus TaxID=407022 RepID=A0A1H7UFR8_OLID1|nr:LytTR family DNA-binding domain-containing protein [Olivibacter domesticus]SEL95077.1 two component transcriptional regulator, LytTR family [Olivibacter domesticus]